MKGRRQKKHFASLASHAF